MATARYGKGIVGLVKQGWNEIPEVLSTSVVALIGVGFAVTAVVMANKKDNIKTYRHYYTVYRDDDPKVAELRKKHPLN